MSKERIKGMVSGFIICAVLSAGMLIVVANPQTVTREITYGVSVSVDGQPLTLEEDNRPFVMGGRTFLPVRALADALGVSIDFDAETNTVNLGGSGGSGSPGNTAGSHTGQRTPLHIAAPFFDSSGSLLTPIEFGDSTMGGVLYRDALRIHTWEGRSTAFTLHNLQGQYRTLSGHVGREDGSGMRNVVINFIGDGVILQSFEMEAANMPVPFEINVEGVQQLKIEVVNARAWSTIYSVSAFLE